MYKNIPQPNYTQIPNIIFDYWMSRLTPNEFKVLLCICRKTFGWHKNHDYISISQIERMTGISRRGIFDHIKVLEQFDLLDIHHSKTKEGDSAPNEYSIKVKEIDSSEINAPPHEKKDVKEKFGSAEFALRGSAEFAPTKERPFTKEKQQQVAAVSYEFLDKIDIPLQDKAWLVENYEEVIIRHACLWALHPLTKIKSTLQQAIKWACENKPEIPKTDIDNSSENKKTATEIQKTLKENKVYRCEVLNKGVELTPLMGNQEPFILLYTEKGFKDQLMNALRKYKLI